MSDNDEIAFEDLNIWLKIAAAGGFIYIAFMILDFLLGFIIGYMGAMP